MGALIHFFKLQAFIVTLAGMFLREGLCYLDRRGTGDTVISLFGCALSRMQCRCSMPFSRRAPSLHCAHSQWLCFAAHWTAFGRTVYAIGGNEQSAQMMGLHVARTKIMVYAVSGFCAALSGVLFSLLYVVRLCLARAGR